MNPTLDAVILASASPRRAEILRMLGVPFHIVPTDIPEVRAPDETPAAYVQRLACAKATAGAMLRPGRWVLAGDTVVALGSQILEKPTSQEHAVAMLGSMAGGVHTVFSGLALSDPNGKIVSRVDQADVWFRSFDTETAQRYARTGEPLDKAGAYGIQGLGASLVERVEGDFFTVVGMSVSGLVDLMERSGRPYEFPQAAPNA